MSHPQVDRLSYFDEGIDISEDELLAVNEVLRAYAYGVTEITVPQGIVDWHRIDLLVDFEELGEVDSFLPREERHWDAVERSRQLAALADMVSTQAPQIPKPLLPHAGPKPVRSERNRGPLVLDRNVPTIAKRRTRHWS